MKDLRAVWSAGPLALAGAVVAALASFSPCHAQVAPPDEAQPGVMSALDEASMYPVQSQTAETPNLNSVNENADTTKYADAALTRGPFFFSVDAMGAWTTNINQTLANQPSVSGTYYDIGIPSGLHLWSSTTEFTAYSKVDAAFYPNHSANNHTSAIYSHQLNHQLSQTTTASWSLAGGHIVTLGHYLSPVIAVGTTGVIAPQRFNRLQSLNDAATTISISHQSSERDSFIAAGTAGWFDQPQANSLSNTHFAYRQITGGGDFQWVHALNGRETGGIDVSNVYIAGLAPNGMSNFTSAKIIFGQTLSSHTSITAGIGPLFSQTSVAGKSQNAVSYSANAAFEYRRIFGHITTGFARMYELSYLTQAATTADNLYFSFDRPLTSKILLTEDLQFVTNHASANQYNYSQFVSTTRIDMYLSHSLDYHFEASSDLQSTAAQIPGYSDNEVSSGFTYYFGSPLPRAGVQ